MSSVSPTAEARPLESFLLAAESRRFASRHWRAALRIAALPAVALLAIQILGWVAAHFGGVEKIWTVHACALVSSVPTAVLGVAWHRTILVGHRSWSGGGWLAAHLRFAGLFCVPPTFGILASLVTRAVGPDLGGVVSAILALASWVLLGVFVRISLVLPATALGQRMTLAESWNRTHGFAWRLFWAQVLAAFVALLALLPIVVPLLLVIGAQGKPASMVEGLAMAVFDPIATVVGVVLWFGVLSFAYRALVGGNGDHDQGGIVRG